MVKKESLDKIHLCLHELQMIKQLIDLSIADDFCSRMLGIYAMIRMDDITKIWSHSIPKDDSKYKFARSVKDQYNKGLRIVRDKLGAHYQSPSSEVDLFGSIKIFKSIDYAKTIDIIDAALEAEAKIEETELIIDGFKESADLSAVKEILKELYSDDKPHITNGALDLFGINKGGLITCTKGQTKGQYLRSLEQMTEVARKFIHIEYIDSAVMLMFRRLYVCMVYNFHDNLITRKDIKVDAEQYEDGFDTLFQELQIMITERCC